MEETVVSAFRALINKWYDLDSGLATSSMPCYRNRDITDRDMMIIQGYVQQRCDARGWDWIVASMGLDHPGLYEAGVMHMKDRRYRHTAWGMTPCESLLCAYVNAIELEAAHA